jgi:polar amino acid transport system permease protein
MTYHFDWSTLWTGQSGGWLLQGVITTLQIFAVGLIIAIVLGICAGALRTVAIAPLRWLASSYVEFFRNVPLLVWMFFGYFSVPPLLPQAIQTGFSIMAPSFGPQYSLWAFTTARAFPK